MPEVGECVVECGCVGEKLRLIIWIVDWIIFRIRILINMIWEGKRRPPLRNPRGKYDRVIKGQGVSRGMEELICIRRDRGGASPRSRNIIRVVNVNLTGCPPLVVKLPHDVRRGCAMLVEKGSQPMPCRLKGKRRKPRWVCGQSRPYVGHQHISQ